MKNSNLTFNKTNKQGGFSLIELIIALTITLFIVAISFTLLAESLNQKVREDSVVSALADANQGLDAISRDLANAGMGLNSNGIVSANSGKNFIRIRSILNAFSKQTSSNKVTDQNEDVAYLVVASQNGKSALVRMDVNSNATSVIGTELDNSDIDNDGSGDGLVFNYLDASGTEVSADNAVQILITLRLKLPQQGVPNSPGYKPATVVPLSSKVFLRNSQLMFY
jgi:type II secretory pathway pseudopilin PulG